MFLKSIKLHNIRSYENAELKFPFGSVLLAGDIGSGKSTILLAIEFAIFGAKKGELPAYTLLRHGKKEGFVEMRMQIDSKDVIIKRTLKRSNDDIKQEAGYIIVNGFKKDATSEELRALVLDMLGYPKDLVRKGKDLLYRYTVYTPQEEMKTILYESNETRLDVLRKVFNIDKYKRVKENSRIIVASLREKKKHLEGFVLDLGYKKLDLEERKKEILEIEKSIKSTEPKINDIKKIISDKKISLEAIEKDIRELNLLKKELSVAEANMSNKIEQNNKLNEEIKRLERQIEDLKENIKGKKLEDLEQISGKIHEKEQEMEEADASYSNTIRKIREIEVKIENCNDTIKNVQSLEICPVCKQEVDESHKQEVHSRESRKCEEWLEQVQKCKEEESNVGKIRIALKKEIESLTKEKNNYSILKIKFENLDDKIREKEEKMGMKDKLKKEIGSLNVKKSDLNSKLEKYSAAEEKYKAIRKEIDELLPQERFLELEKRKYETEKLSTQKFIANLEREIQEKQKAQEKLVYTSQLINWIDELFMNLMLTMEKHVMANIHSQFNEVFKNWFDILMEDEAIRVRVDEEFTPIIEQDGYETYVENLSGGERTAVALSYRLALNKVINDIIADIRTKDIIMLDEPTDGFSSEQLDKVKHVLEQLNMKQVIIVSHEAKIESFVENVIRVQKQDSVSVVA